MVNAADNAVRNEGPNKTKNIKVEIDPENNLISIENDGKGKNMAGSHAWSRLLLIRLILGIPVEIHKDEKVYIPELIFGHLLTSSNYNDSEEKVSGK